MNDAWLENLHIARSPEEFIKSQYELFEKKEKSVKRREVLSVLVGFTAALLSGIYAWDSDSDNYKLRSSLYERRNIEYSLGAEKDRMATFHSTVPMDTSSRAVIYEHINHSKEIIDALEEKLEKLNEGSEMREYNSKRSLGLKSMFASLGMALWAHLYFRRIQKRLKKSRQLLEERSYPSWCAPNKHSRHRFD